MSSAAAAGVLVVAILGAPFVIWRAIVAQKTVNVAEQGLITDRINKAVEGLGAEKTVKQVVETPRYRKDEKGDWLFENGKLVPALRPDGTPLIDRETVERTMPNLEVRIGAIYALERIAQDSLRDHVQIMETLCAYIRENAPAAQAPKLPEPPELDALDYDIAKKIFDRWEAEHRKALATFGENGGPIRPREDIQVALTVIARRGKDRRELERGKILLFPEYPDSANAEKRYEWQKKVEEWRDQIDSRISTSLPFRLNLQRANLIGAEFHRDGQFDFADLSESRVEGSDLMGVHLNGAYLTGTQINGAELWQARLNGADLGRAQLNGANLYQVGLRGAEMGGARLNGAYLREADMRGASLGRTRLNGAALGWARLDGAHLSRTFLLHAELDDAILDDAVVTEACLHEAVLRNASLKGARFTLSHLDGANLTNAELQGCDFRLARLVGVRLSRVQIDRRTSLEEASLDTACAVNTDLSHSGLSIEQIATMFGDGSVSMPYGITPDHPDWPAHWPKEKLGNREFIEAWREWQANSAATPPRA